MIKVPDGADHDDVTQLLRAWSDGDTDAFERVMPLVNHELHRMAARYVRVPALDLFARQIAREGWMLQAGDRVASYTMDRRLGTRGDGRGVAGTR